MDLQSFAEDDFDPKKWINRAWSSCGNQGKEAFVSSTVSRLQLYMKQLTNSLDETTNQIVSSIPSILQDASSLQLEGALLQQKLQGLEQKVQGVEEQTGQSIQSLQKIDQLKSRLENAASSLREADKWTVQVAALEEILENGVPTAGDKLVEVTDLVAAMTLSLEVLSDAPDYENKKFQLETLYNRLEAAVTPPLLEAFTQMDADRSATYVRIFRSMNRGMSCSRALRRATATRLSRAWRDQSSHCARALHALLCGNCNEQVQWFSDVLGSDKPVSEVVRLFTDLLLSVDPSPNKIVSASLKLCATPEQGVTLLIDLRRDIDDFIANIRVVIDSNSKETVEHSTLRQLGRAAYAPLREAMPQLTQILSRQLIDHLNDIYEQNDVTEHSRKLVSIVERSQGWMAAAHSCSKAVAGNCAVVVYTPALEAFVSELSSHLTSHTRRIETEFLTSVATGKCSGVLAGTFPAALLLENAVSLLLDLLAERHKCDLEDSSTEIHPLTDLPSLLLDPASQSRLSEIRSEPLSVISAVRRIKQQLTNLAKTVLMQPLHAQLDKVPTLSVWNNNDPMTTDLPDFALSPQEYITEIGQYLMTLPQHLEMHLSDKQAPLQFLAEVCNDTCDTYAEKILNIKNMDELGTKRCYTDIVYLSSVVEDLGSNVTHSLKSLEKSLRAATPVTNE